MQNTHQHYFKTGAEVKSDFIIDDMFAKLDEDGGGTLDCGEIQALFHENGIHMSMAQVANMFGEAQRMNSCDEYKRMTQNGLQSRADPRSIQRKSTEYYRKMNMDPEAWKKVTKSGASLKSKSIPSVSIDLLR